MKHLGQHYVQYVNRTRGRSGSLWEGRFRSSLVEIETYFLRCHRYIELNPVRAGMVRSPEGEAYLELFRTELESRQLEEIRVWTNAGYAIGSDRFRREIEQESGRRAGPGKSGRPIRKTADQRQNRLL
jgi:putative transposase